MKRIFSIFLVALSLLLLGVKPAVGQSDNFNFLKNLDIQYNILRILSTDFVDSIKYDKVILKGINSMLESLDPYTEYIPAENKPEIDLITTSSYDGIGSVIRKVDSLGVIISQPYANSPAIKYGLETGDIILEIDGADTKPLSSDECSKRMRGPSGSIVKFKVKKGRGGEVKDIEVVRGKVHTPDISYAGILYNLKGEKTSYGYISLGGFTLGGGEEFRNKIKELKDAGAQKIIVDLRGNGGGIMDEAVDVVSAFVPKGSLVVTSKGRGKGSTFEYSTTKEPIDTQIPVMILTNSSSASSSEIVAGALQDWDRATIMGTRTFGKGLVQSFRNVGYDGNLKLTISKYYTPSGRCIQAMDYSKRNEDGSVSSVPDSLKKEFKTLVKGRSVYDGGGITPDSTITSDRLSRTLYSLVMNGVLDDYAVEFYKKNKEIGDLRTFELNDKQYEDFIKYVQKQNIDIRSGVEVAYDQMIEMAKSENLYEIDKEYYETLAKRVKLSKPDILRACKKEIAPVLEEEIATRYGFTEGGYLNGIKNDKTLWKAIDAWK